MALQDVSLLIDTPCRKKDPIFRAWQDALLQHRDSIATIARGIGVHPNTLYNAINCRQEPSFGGSHKQPAAHRLQIKYEKSEENS